MTKKERDDLRRAIADYVWSEGCSCCQNTNAHESARTRLGALLGIRPNKEGWHDLAKFRTPLGKEGVRE